MPHRAGGPPPEGRINSNTTAEDRRLQGRDQNARHPGRQAIPFVVRLQSRQSPVRRQTLAGPAIAEAVLEAIGWGMPIERRFLGWRGNLREGVCRALLRDADDGLVDLHDVLVVVASRQASRRLSDALSEACAGRGGLLCPTIVTPGRFLQALHPPSAAVADPFAVSAAWVDVLLREDPGRRPHLFPEPPPTRGIAWAMETSRLLQRMRAELAEAGCTIQDVVREHGGQLPEADRWRDLASLEGEVDKALETIGLIDPLTAQRRQLHRDPDDLPYTRVVIAAVPDPPAWLAPYVDRLAGRVPIEIYVHASEEDAGRFDAIGRPLVEAWIDSPIPIAEPDERIHLVSDARAQARKAAALLTRGLADHPGRAVAIGTPDSEVVRFLEDEVRRVGLEPFVPQSVRLADHRVIAGLAAFTAFMQTDEADATWTLVRHPDVLHWLADGGVEPETVLEQVDVCRKRHLPVRPDDIRRALDQDAHSESPRFGDLREALTRLRGLARQVQDRDPAAGTRYLLAAWYGERAIVPGDAGSDLLVRVIEEVADCADALARLPFKSLTGDGRALRQFLLHTLRDRDVDPAPRDADLALEGWLELAWNDAPHLVLTGMNEGKVPDSGGNDPFLPDHLRERLGIRHEARRFARDTFLLRGLLEARAGGGRVDLVLGKVSLAGDPLKPSRLLLRSGREELPGRVRRLFAGPEDRQPNVPATVSFKLDPNAVSPEVSLPVDSLRVTAFRDYLHCPFLFYLKHVLRLDAVDTGPAEMDALDFGNLVHRALEHLVTEDGLKTSTDARLLTAVFHKAVDRWIERRYGAAPSLSVEVQRQAAYERLASAARVQAQLVGEGWEIQHAEVPVETEISGMRITGTIDRIDRHRDTGAWRILDYKTSESGKAPIETHLGAARDGMRDYRTVTAGSREKAWVDLQLPLYIQLLEAVDETFEGEAEIGYFQLPKAVTDTQVNLWVDFDRTLAEAARRCVFGVVADVYCGRFWPPAPDATARDFAGLFGDPVERWMAPPAGAEAVR